MEVLCVIKHHLFSLHVARTRDCWFLSRAIVRLTIKCVLARLTVALFVAGIWMEFDDFFPLWVRYAHVFDLIENVFTEGCKSGPGVGLPIGCRAFFLLDVFWSAKHRAFTVVRQTSSLHLMYALFTPVGNWGLWNKFYPRYRCVLVTFSSVVAGHVRLTSCSMYSVVVVFAAHVFFG